MKEIENLKKFDVFKIDCSFRNEDFLDRNRISY